MTDLHAAIRERLDARPIITTDAAPEAAPRINNWVSKAHDALAALLDWHTLGYRYSEEPGKPPNWCHACNDIGPCDTIQIIARELGIET